MTVGGSGLGLAIVKAIAERNEALVVLGDSSLGGLAAEVIFYQYGQPRGGGISVCSLRAV